MIQIVAVVVGAMAILAGIKGLSGGEVQLSRSTTLKGQSAKTAGLIALIIGVALVAFALFGLPLLTGSRR